MLIFDGHTSRFTYDFIDFCWSRRIWPFFLLSHMMHILQLLDVAVFQPFKYYHKKRVEIETRLGYDNFNKVEFLHAIQDVRKKAYKPGTIQLAFKQAGLWPYDPSIVLLKLKTVDQPQTPLPPLLEAVLSPPTPYKAWQLDEFARKHMHGIDLETGQWGILPGRFSKFQKGAVAAALNGEKAGEKLVQVNVATNACKKRQKGDHIQKGGTIYVYDARLRVAEREEEDARKKDRAAAKGKPKA
ncbi:hypothetical protein K469DRAFT_654839 [Zopfia rhizophila CBS 207.26]|uniref:DDE-1 domain-containing protein n=1 Tax=Zopfia rhizophila CBS 207.26 TaxID=1314779 RepID=A0A6A6ELS6_9PEZI|nr:hypothetical protein K469DRAFT_654839 [Zopfia rhizophila CBS 207.26]